MRKPNEFSPEAIGPAVRLILDYEADHASQWPAIGSIAAQIGGSAETLRRRARRV